MSAPFPAEPVPAQAGGTEQPPHGGMGMGRARHMPEVFQTWHDGKPPSSLPPSLPPPSICSSASQLPALVPDVLSQAPGGSWKQKMVLPLASAQPAHVPAGKS